MNVNIEQLTYKAQRHYAEIAYSLEGINGHPATQKEILDYLLTTMADFEEIVGDPITWISDQRKKLSRETKPASPWISVEERLPEPYVEVYAGSFDDDGDFGQTICWHTGDAWEGIEITVDTMITYWAEKLPAPPESLTDKTSL